MTHSHQSDRKRIVVSPATDSTDTAFSEAQIKCEAVPRHEGKAKYSFVVAVYDIGSITPRVAFFVQSYYDRVVTALVGDLLAVHVDQELFFVHVDTGEIAREWFSAMIIDIRLTRDYLLAFSETRFVQITRDGTRQLDLHLDLATAWNVHASGVQFTLWDGRTVDASISKIGP